MEVFGLGDGIFELVGGDAGGEFGKAFFWSGKKFSKKHFLIF